MSSGFPPPSPGYTFLKGVYTSKSGFQIPFTAKKSDPGIVTFILENNSSGIKEATGGAGYVMDVTEQSFTDFKEKVLNKDVNWTNVKHIRFANIVPGTWRSITGDEDSEVFNKAIKGYGGSRKHNHRKPTKRRRSRRVYRKTKKN